MSREIPFGPGPLNGLRVMVAHSHPLTAEQLCLLLEEEGARLIGPCATVKCARHLVRTEAPELVLLDLALTDDFADTLVAEMEALAIPFAIVTAYAALPTNAHEAAIATFRAPFDWQALIALLTAFS